MSALLASPLIPGVYLYHVFNSFPQPFIFSQDGGGSISLTGYLNVTDRELRPLQLAHLFLKQKVVILGCRVVEVVFCDSDGCRLPVEDVDSLSFKVLPLDRWVNLSLTLHYKNEHLSSGEEWERLSETVPAVGVEPSPEMIPVTCRFEVDVSGESQTRIVHIHRWARMAQVQKSLNDQLLVVAGFDPAAYRVERLNFPAEDQIRHKIGQLLVATVMRRQE